MLPAQPAPMPPVWMMPPPVQTRRSSPGLWTAGLVTMVVSAVLLPAGIAMLVGGSAAGGCHKQDTDILCGAGGTAGGLGLLGLAGGIVMMVIGGQRVPLNAPQHAWWLPTPEVSANAGSLTWTF